jgi:multidrug resistance efflux pump
MNGRDFQAEMLAMRRARARGLVGLLVLALAMGGLIIGSLLLAPPRQQPTTEDARGNYDG